MGRRPDPGLSSQYDHCFNELWESLDKVDEILRIVRFDILPGQEGLTKEVLGQFARAARTVELEVAGGVLCFDLFGCRHILKELADVRRHARIVLEPGA